MNNKDIFGNIDLSKIMNSAQPVFHDPLEKHTRQMEQVLKEASEHRAKVDQAIIDTSRTNQKIAEEAQEMNRQLMHINSNLEKQLQSINSSIDFIINTLGSNAQISEEQQHKNQKLLLEIQILLVQKDEKGLKAFIDRRAGDAICLSGVILQAISMIK